jgi:hypothetical protein
MTNRNRGRAEERRRAHEKAVRREKARIRKVLDAGRPVLVKQWLREHLTAGNYAAHDALQELTPEIRELGLDASEGGPGSTRERIAEAVLGEAGRDAARRTELGEERARRQVEDYARSKVLAGDSRLGSANRGRGNTPPASLNSAPGSEALGRKRRKR